MTAIILPFRHPAPVPDKGDNTADLALLDVSCLDAFLRSAPVKIREAASTDGDAIDEGLFIGMAAVHGYELEAIDGCQALIMIDGHRYQVHCEVLYTPAFAAAVLGALETESEANTALARCRQARQRLQDKSNILHCGSPATAALVEERQRR